jgi:enoyl-CoA hydratase/carnithine racemase
MIRSELQAGVLLLKLNRPRSLNALNREMLVQLRELLQTAAEDRSARVIVITGEGEKAFAAGADVSEFADASDVEQGISVAHHGQDAFSAIEQLHKPVVAAINGYALGGGMELALACDIRFASDQAMMGLPEVKLGILPGFGGTQRLPRLVGRGAANYLMMSGDRVTAEEALRLGLVDKVVPQAQLIEKTVAFARRLASMPPGSLAAIKTCIRQGIEMTLGEGLSLEAEHFGRLMVSRDGKEGVQAFLDKREARFTGE